jgi:hypothetical protein
MIRETQAHACGCHSTPRRRLGDASSDAWAAVQSYQPGGSNYTPTLAEDTYSPPSEWQRELTAPTLPGNTGYPSSGTNWPVIAAAGIGTLLLLAALMPPPSGKRR